MVAPPAWEMMGFAAREASWLIADAQPRSGTGQFDGMVEYRLEKGEVGIDAESRVDQDKALDGSNCRSESLDWLRMKADTHFRVRSNVEHIAILSKS